MVNPPAASACGRVCSVLDIQPGQARPLIGRQRRVGRRLGRGAIA